MTRREREDGAASENGPIFKSRIIIILDAVFTLLLIFIEYLKKWEFLDHIQIVIIT